MSELLTAKLICDYLEDMYYFFIEKEIYPTQEE